MKKCSLLIRIFSMPYGYAVVVWNEPAEPPKPSPNIKRSSRTDGELVRRWMGYAYALIGDTETALATAARVETERQQAYFISQTCGGTLRRVEKHGQSHFLSGKCGGGVRPWLLGLPPTPHFDNLRFHPRFNNLIRPHQFSKRCPPFDGGKPRFAL